MTPSLGLSGEAVRIAGAGVAFPDDEVTTDALVDRLAGSLPPARRANLARHTREELGVDRRAFVARDASAWTLAVAAARAALSEAPGLVPVAHLHATSTPSRWTGPDAARIGASLGLTAAFFDVRGGCSGGLWALIEGARLCAASTAPVLVSAADAFSLAFPHDERMLPLAMGDGAAALLLVPADPSLREAPSCPGLVRAVLGGAPAHHELATVSAPLPPRGGEAFTFSGDVERFAPAQEDALRGVAAALAAPADALVLVSGPAHLGARVAGGARRWSASLWAHGQVGAASLLVGMVEARAAGERGLLALLSAGGGIGFAGALWQLEPRGDGHAAG